MPPRAIYPNRLTDAGIQSAKPRRRAYKLADGEGMYLLVQPSGAKYWRLKYRFAGKEKALAFGVYPDVSLDQARFARDSARAVIQSGNDPAASKRESRASARRLEMSLDKRGALVIKSLALTIRVSAPQVAALRELLAAETPLRRFNAD